MKMPLVPSLVCDAFKLFDAKIGVSDDFSKLFAVFVWGNTKIMDF